MRNGNSRYTVRLSVNPQLEEDSKEFAEAAYEFVDSLKAVRDLQVTVPEQTVPGTRGILALLSGIIVVGTKIGAFAALYNLACDLYARFKNAEVKLHFDDGSTLSLKGLSRSEAEKLITEHLESKHSVAHVKP